MKKSYLALFVFLIIIFFVFGFLFGKTVSDSGEVVAVVNQESTYEDGWNALRDRVINSGIIQYQEQENTYMGEVSNKADSELTIKLIHIDPLAQPELDSRVVKVGVGTDIYEMVEKQVDVYQQEMTKYLQENKERGPDSGEGTPSMFVKEKRTIGDVVVGQRIIVKSDENIKAKNEFIAKEIILQ